MTKYWKIHLSFSKKGDIKNFKPMLKYINDTYSPHYLKFIQSTFYEHMRSKPIAGVDFIMYARDGIHILDDFIEQYGKKVLTGSASPYKWSHKSKPKDFEKTISKKIANGYKMRNQ